MYKRGSHSQTDEPPEGKVAVAAAVSDRSPHGQTCAARGRGVLCSGSSGPGSAPCLTPILVDLDFGPRDTLR